MADDYINDTTRNAVELALTESNITSMITQLLNLGLDVISDEFMPRYDNTITAVHSIDYSVVSRKEFDEVKKQNDLLIAFFNDSTVTSNSPALFQLTVFKPNLSERISSPLTLKLCVRVSLKTTFSSPPVSIFTP